MSIKTKILTAMALLSLTMASMFLVTFVFTGAMSSDAVSINLAGRQRMLIQKIGKELLLLHDNASQEKEKLADMARNSLTLFEATLTAMRNGGDAPATLQAGGPTGAFQSVHRLAKPRLPRRGRTGPQSTSA